VVIELVAPADSGSVALATQQGPTRFKTASTLPKPSKKGRVSPRSWAEIPWVVASSTDANHPSQPPNSQLFPE